MQTTTEDVARAIESGLSALDGQPGGTLEQIPRMVRRLFVLLPKALRSREEHAQAAVLEAIHEAFSDSADEPIFQSSLTEERQQDTIEFESTLLGIAETAERYLREYANGERASQEGLGQIADMMPQIRDRIRKASQILVKTTLLVDTLLGGAVPNLTDDDLVLVKKSHFQALAQFCGKKNIDYP